MDEKKLRDYHDDINQSEDLEKRMFAITQMNQHMANKQLINDFLTLEPDGCMVAALEKVDIAEDEVEKVAIAAAPLQIDMADSTVKRLVQRLLIRIRFQEGLLDHGA